MADLDQRPGYDAAYSGLVKNLWLTIGIAGVCLIGYEIEVHIPRRRGRRGTFRRIPVRIYLASARAWARWNSRPNDGTPSFTPSTPRRELGTGDEKLADERARIGDRESWEFGYIYQPRSWALNRGPPLPRWPLMWIISSLRIRERDMPEKCGLDLTLHARFLRGCFFYTLLQTAIVLPILLPLHMLYAPDNIIKTSMLRAGIDGLVSSSGSKWLWVHAVLIWWISITWTCTALWIGWGGLAYRRRGIARLRQKVEKSRGEKRQASGGEEGLLNGNDTSWPVAEKCEGIKKFRTLMVINVPPDMRDEQTLQDYFDYYIKLHRIRKGEAQVTGMMVPPAITGTRPSTDSGRHFLFHPGALVHKLQSKRDAELPPVLPTLEKDERTSADGCAVLDDHASEVDEVILVRKLGSISSLRERRTKVLRQLEMAHVELAQRVLGAVRSHKARFYPTGHLVELLRASGGLMALKLNQDTKLPMGITKTQRLDLLTRVLADYVDDADAQVGKTDQTVWDILHTLPRELLDPYQALTHLKVTAVWRKKNAPLIDYLTTKLVYLTMLLDDAREKELEEYQAASTAFVSFKDARTARLALRILDSHPKRSLACHTVPAPDWTDLLWPRLGRSVYRSELVRSWVTFIAVWAFTLAWIFPVSLFCSLTSLDRIGGFLPPLRQWLDRNPNAASSITSLAPVILVALLTIAICPILLVVANKAQTIVTRKEIHNSVMERFWKFLMVNAVVFFAIGQSAIETYLIAFQENDFDPLPVVASAFPTAAPYFASYLLLQVAIQPFFEIFRFGLPAIVYVFGTRVSKLPRQRDSRTEHPTFSHFSQVPYQLLGGAIMHLFMVLNPLVIPFTLVYYGACYLVWKRQFTYVYGRLYETNGERSSIRILRYSLDALALGQFVLFAFFILNKAKGNAIATGHLFFFTLIAKLIITRALRRRFLDLSAEEADILCPPVEDAVGDEDACPSRLSETPDSRDRLNGSKESDDHFLVAKAKAWVGKWHFATKFIGHDTPTGYRRPIAFDNLIFSRLDKWIAFDPEEKSKEEPVSDLLASPSLTDPRLVHEPDQPIHHDLPNQLVVPHPPLAPWEDIPPYQRMRGYCDQPAYTDDYDDFLWLPRDPLSTLDLDDTVEMRLSLTTTAGGSGRIGDWPPEYLEDEVHNIPAISAPEWQEVLTDQPPLSPNETIDMQASPSGQSERRLIEDVELSPLIGSEVSGVRATTSTLGLRTVALALGSFRRPRTATSISAETGISMDTFSSHSRSDTRRDRLPSSDVTPTRADRLDRPDRPESQDLNLLSPLRVATPTSTYQPDFGSTTPHRSESDPPHPPHTSSIMQSGSTHRSQTMPLRPMDEENDPFLAPRTAPPAILNIHSPVAEPSPMSVHSRQATRLTFAASELGRSPHGPRPMPQHPAHGRLRSGTTNSRSSDRTSNAGGTAPRSGSGILRTASILSRDRSTSGVSASQRALLSEVMEEERLASKSAKAAEVALTEREKDELQKEKERCRKSGLEPQGSSDVRRGSWMESVHEIGRGMSMRRRSQAEEDSGLP